MKLILDKVWLGVMLLGTICFYTFMVYILYLSFLDEGLSFLFNQMFFIILSIVLLSFSYLIAVYIQRTKKDIEMVEIMETLHKRTDGYNNVREFYEGTGAMGQLVNLLDHGGFFLLPFIQKRKNYKDIDVKKIPFNKKFPFILFFVSLMAVPVLGFIAWLI